MSFRAKLDGLDVSFSHHALERLVQMRVPSWEVHLCLTEPDHIDESRKYPGTFHYVRRDVTLSVCKSKGHIEVITALYSNNNAWKRAAESGQIGEDREYRPNASLPTHRREKSH